MAGERSFLISDVPGFTPRIGRLVSMLRYVRETTLDAVDGLGIEELDYVHDAESNSIGALLAHVAAVEEWYQASTFRGVELDPRDMGEWGAGLDLGGAARRKLRGRPLNAYLTRLAELAARDDAWLEDTSPFWNGRPANNHFKWFHVFEDELNHRGQIRWLRARALRVSQRISDG